MSEPLPASPPSGPVIPKIKRKRAPLACESCRYRKRTCCGSRPSCGSCIAHGYICQWPARDKRRRVADTVKGETSEIDPMNQPVCGGSGGGGEEDESPPDRGGPSSVRSLSQPNYYPQDPAQSAEYDSSRSLQALLTASLAASTGPTADPKVFPPPAPTSHLSPNYINSNQRQSFSYNRPQPQQGGHHVQFASGQSFPHLASLASPEDRQGQGSHQSHQTQNQTQPRERASSLRRDFPHPTSTTSNHVISPSSSSMYANQGSMRAPELPSNLHSQLVSDWDLGVGGGNAVASGSGGGGIGSGDAGMGSGGVMSAGSQLGGGSEGRVERISYEYLRPYGPTAISPGLGRIKLSIRQNLTSASPSAPSETALLQSIFQPRLSDYGTSPYPFNPTLAPSHKTGPSPSASETSHAGLLEPHSRLPRADLREKLFDVFFERFASMFPFMERGTVDEGIRRGGEVGVVMLANTMCALAARFCNVPEIVAINPLSFCRGVPFADNAKQLLIPLLGMPSTSITASLLFLSYYDLGMNSEAGVWNYAGMALRMAIDLGLHRRLRTTSTSRHNRHLFWCVFLLDRVLAIGTGRPVGMLDEHIEVEEPDSEHLPHSNRPHRELAFTYNIRLTKLYGQIAQTANGSSYWLGRLTTVTSNPTRASSPVLQDGKGVDGRMGTRVSPGYAHGMTDSAYNTHRKELLRLSGLESEIMDLYNSLPPNLVWSMQNLQHHIRIGDADMFLHLHLWYYCIIGILYRDPLVNSRATFADLDIKEALDIQKSAARRIHEICSSLPSEHYGLLMNNPFLNQPFYTAACTWIPELRQHEARRMAKAHALLSSSAMEYFTASAKILRHQAEVWLGVGWIAAALAKRGAGLSLQDIIKGGSTDTILSEAEMRIITMEDGNSGETDAALLDLRADLWDTLPMPDSSFNNGFGSLNVPIWGADGLFDSDFDQLFGLGAGGYVGGGVGT